MSTVQVSPLVAFADAACIAVPLASPARPGSTLAVAFMLVSSEVTIARLDDSATGLRWWRLANDTLMSPAGRRVCWVRTSGGPAGAVEIIGEPANACAPSTPRGARRAPVPSTTAG